MKRKATWAGIINDNALIFLLSCLLVLSFIVITSTTLFVAERQYHDPFFFIYRHLKHIVCGVFVFMGVKMIPTRYWVETRMIALIVALIGLCLVFVPGLGLEINGAKRWLKLGPLVCQTSEISKLCFLIYLSAHLSKARRQALSKSVLFWLQPLAALFFMTILLCMQPDFGSAIVLSMVSLLVMYIAGIPVRSLIVIGTVGVTLAVICAVIEPYRMLRLITFTDPWKYAYGSGYQLTQSLMAIGRGGYWGVGLGSGLQKIFYLPEAHTDFIFAILCEEAGIIGAAALLLLYFLLVLRIWSWAYYFESQNKGFEANYAIALGTWLATQVGVSVGVNIGLLPTKGLALPLLSYGGTHLAVTCCALGILARMIHTFRPTASRSRTRRKRYFGTRFYERF